MSKADSTNHLPTRILRNRCIRQDLEPALVGPVRLQARSDRVDPRLVEAVGEW